MTPSFHRRVFLLRGGQLNQGGTTGTASRPYDVRRFFDSSNFCVWDGKMTIDPFSEPGKDVELVPVVREIPGDLDSPISIYLKLAEGGPSFLLESVTGGKQVARYSFMGVGLNQAYVLRGQTLEHHTARGVEQVNFPEDGDPFGRLQAVFRKYKTNNFPNLPRFTGGLVGYLSYDAVRYFEPTVNLTPHPELPDGIFLLADTVVAYDHAFGRLLLITHALSDGDSQVAYDQAEARLDKLEAQVTQPLPSKPLASSACQSLELCSSMSEDEFSQKVFRAKEHINAGDIFQVVLAQRLSRKTTASPIGIYRTLRRLNPSPYMFHINFGQLASKRNSFHLIGASPEMHTRLEGRKATLRPIAGTRPRGHTPEEDITLADHLLADPKERAEHVMLVDLGRNDLGRVCDYGTVEVTEKMVIERYSHVMHIASNIEGKLRSAYDAFDLLKATFPAGTVSGAPKIRAMQIIQDLERESRGPYAGIVGYFSFNGSMDSCITIRTMVMQDQKVHIKVGAGIVADSDPQREYQETLDKAQALAEAVDNAEERVETQTDQKLRDK